MRKDRIMTFEIRAMRPDESVAVAQLFHDVWHETQAQLQDLRKAAVRGYGFFKGRVDMPEVRTLVAVTEDQIIGFARWSLGNLRSLFVDQGHRGKGVGEKLCHAVLAANRDESGGSLQLDCVEVNRAARRFYERQGWRVSETINSIDETSDSQIVVRHWVMVRTER